MCQTSNGATNGETSEKGTPHLGGDMEKYGAVARDRTVDLVINSHTLYRLSYNGLLPAIVQQYLMLFLGDFVTYFIDPVHYFIESGGQFLHEFVVLFGDYRTFLGGGDEAVPLE